MKRLLIFAVTALLVIGLPVAAQPQHTRGPVRIIPQDFPLDLRGLNLVPLCALLRARVDREALVFGV